MAPQSHRDGQPGEMWRYPPGDVPGRECWWIVVPNDLHGSGREYAELGEVSWRTTDRAARPPHAMWEVTGTPPRITVTPSIDIEYHKPDGSRDGAYWHGHITDGVLGP